MIVFINSSDTRTSKQLAADLQHSGLSITFDSNDLCDVRLVIVDSKSVIDWEMVRQWPEPVIPVLFAEYDVPIPTEKPVDLSQIYTIGYQDLLKRLQDLAIKQAVNPYKGLPPYREFDAPFFYGCKAVTDELFTRLENQENNTVILTGAGGSGKTSQVQAALIPLLRKSNPPWIPVTIPMDDQPIQQLAHALKVFSDTADSSYLYSKPDALSDLLAEIANQGSRLVVILDNFESVFTQLSRLDRVYVLDILLRAIQRETRKYAFCIILREDYVGRLREYPQWADLLTESQVPLTDLSPDEVTDIIRRPSEQVGKRIPKALVERLQQDYERLSKYSPLGALSFTLQSLLQNEKIDLPAYNQLGKVNGSIAKHAEQVYSELTPLQQVTAKRLLLQQFELSEEGDRSWVCRGTPYTRFSAEWVTQGEVQQTLRQLLLGGLLTTYVDFRTDEKYVELSNEGLSYHWPRLGGWIDEDAGNLRYGSQLERQAKVWATRDYSEKLLLRGAALDEAANWAKRTEYLPSELLQNYMTVSNELRQSFEVKAQQTKFTLSWASRVTAILLVLALLVLAGGAVFTAGTVGERDNLATKQVNTNYSLGTSVAQATSLSNQIQAVATRQQDTNNQLATSVVQYNEASTAQAAAVTAQANVQATADQAQVNFQATAQQDQENLQMTAQAAQATAQQDQKNLQMTAQAAQAAASATINALMQEQAANATAVAGVQVLQTTLEAYSSTQQELRQYIANSLATQSEQVMTSNPRLALRLVAEAGAIQVEIGDGNGDSAVSQAMRDVLKPHLIENYGQGIQNTWFLKNNQLAVIDFAEKPDELWQVDPPQLAAQLSGPVKQIISLGDERFFLVAYADQTPDELWSTETHKVIAPLHGNIAPSVNETTQEAIPNVTPLGNGTYFVVKYQNGKNSELWWAEEGKVVRDLEGDVERVVPLADGMFFARFTDAKRPGAIWETSSGEKLLEANDVIATLYNNDMFVLRRDGAFDEVWTTSPFAKVFQADGRIDSVGDLARTNYFVVQYTGNRPAEIWQSTTTPKLVKTFRGSIDLSTTYYNGKYFLVRYADQSPSEIWSTSPLAVVAVLNGHLTNMNLKLVLDEEDIVLDYTNNPTSELWSLKNQERLSLLSGPAAQSIPILGDAALAVRYKDTRPAEIWNAIEAKRMAKLGPENQVVDNLVTLKDGNFIIVVYKDAPSGLWQVTPERIGLLTTLADTVVRVFPFAGGDYFAVNYQSHPAEIWRSGDLKPLMTLNGSIQQMSYNKDTQQISYSTGEAEAFRIDFGSLVELDNPEKPLATADLLNKVCVEIASGQTVSDSTLIPYLGGLAPLGCPPVSGSTQ